MDNQFFLAVIKATLVIFIVHFVLKRQIASRSLLQPHQEVVDGKVASASSTAPIPKSASPAIAEVRGAQSDVSSEISEADIRSKLQDFADSYAIDDDDYQPEAEGDCHGGVEPDGVDGDVQGLTYYSSYRPASMTDASQRVDVASHVRLPSKAGRPDKASPTQPDYLEEGVMNGGQLMEGVIGFDSYHDDFYTL